MKQGRKETITTRIISTTFMVVALAVFKPFGLDACQWQAYVHLAAFWVIGFSICMMTDIILKYVIKMPRSSTQLLIKHCHESLPVSRSNMSQVKAAIKRGQSDAGIDSAEREQART